MSAPVTPGGQAFVPLPFDARDLSPEEIDARFRWARQRGHPHYLWPNIPIPAWRAGLGKIERVTAKLLDPPCARVRLELIDDIEVEALGVAAFTSGMGPLLGCWIETGVLETEAELEALLRLHLEHGRRRVARLEWELTQVLDTLRDAGIVATVIKGAHTSRAYFPQPGTRPMADIDLVVASQDIEIANRALAAAGYIFSPVRYSWPASHEWIPPSAPRSLRSIELTHAENPYTIELHGSLDRDFYGVRTLNFDLFHAEGSRPWQELHVAARVLVQPLLVALLAAHTAQELQYLPLVRLAELVLVIRQDSASDRLDWAALSSMIERLDARRFVYPAFELVERLVPGTIDGDFSAQLRRAATPRMRRMLERLGPSTAQQLGEASLDIRFMWAAGAKEHLRRAGQLVWPPRAGRSLRRLRDIYRERLYQVLRGRVPLLTAHVQPERRASAPKRASDHSDA